jgi:hypothetical protein
MARTHEVKILFSPEEYDRVKKKADEFSQPVSTFCRMIALKAKIEVKVDDKY